MHFANILTIAALATSTMAGYAGRPTNGGSLVDTGDKASSKKPAHHYVRNSGHEHSGEKGDARHHEGKIDRRGNGGVYWCSKDNWKGSCTKSPADGKCHKWAAGPQGSFGPDPGVTCTFWEGQDCTGAHTTVKYPGSGQAYFFSPGGGVDYPPEAWKCHN